MLILQCINVISSVSPVGTAVPLVLVLAVTMIKDGYDDVQRHKQDRFLNNKITRRVAPDGSIEEIPWKDVMTGNLIMVEKDENVPADLVLLASVDEEGLAFIETAELDGETNLQIKVSVFYKTVKQKGDPCLSFEISGACTSAIQFLKADINVI